MTDLRPFIDAHNRTVLIQRKAESALSQLRADLQTAQQWLAECTANEKQAWETLQAAHAQRRAKTHR